MRLKSRGEMNYADETTYLGASITTTVDPKHKIRKRKTATMAGLKKVDISWLKANCNRRWKVLVYNAVIVSKLLYGLESLEPTDATGSRKSAKHVSTQRFEKDSQIAHDIRTTLEHKRICVPEGKRSCECTNGRRWSQNQTVN